MGSSSLGHGSSIAVPAALTLIDENRPHVYSSPPQKYIRISQTRIAVLQPESVCGRNRNFWIRFKDQTGANEGGGI